MVKPLLFAMKIDLTVNHWFARSRQILVVNKGQMVMLHFISENMYILHINKILVSKKSMFHQIRFLLALSYTVGGGGHKVPALISKIRIFAMNTATATKFGDFS